MIVIRVRNVHEALPKGLQLLEAAGQARNSRFGPVIQADAPVTTVYENPCERVIFWPERDANPFFHLYESLWMLAGRNDIEPLTRYAKDFGQFSDDGQTMHDAYGKRWRDWFIVSEIGGPQTDQLKIIADTLRKNPEDRRCVLQMWDPTTDLGKKGKAFPCNTTAVFQIGPNGKLDLTVFCRSNDIIWGAYGANAVHFSALLEYMAVWIGCRVGVYNQVSTNYHAYVNALEKVKHLSGVSLADNPYDDHAGLGSKVQEAPMSEYRDSKDGEKDPEQAIQFLDLKIKSLLNDADTGFQLPSEQVYGDIWSNTVFHVLRAHSLWKSSPKSERLSAALGALKHADGWVDWAQAAREWFERRA